MSKTHPTIGFLMNEIGGYQLAIWSGAYDFVKENNLNLLSFVGGKLDVPSSLPLNIVYDLVDTENLDGLLVMSSTIGSDVTKDRFESFIQKYRQLPMASLGLEVIGAHNLLVENEAGLKEAMRHLIEDHGYRRIAFISGPDGYTDSTQRYNVYTESLAKYNIPFDPLLVAPGDFQGSGGRKAVELFLDERQVALEAIVAANDYMALGAMEELKQRGILIPQEIAIVGFDDVVEAKSLNPPLTTIRQPLYMQGWLAVENLLAIMKGEAAPSQTLLPTELVIRQSCGCFSEAVSQAVTSPYNITGQKKTTPSSLTAIMEQQREQILADMANAIDAQIIGRVTGWAERLLDAAINDLSIEFVEGTNTGAFIAALEEVLNSATMIEGREMDWQNLISTLRRSITPFLTEPATIAHAENVWNQGRVFVGEILAQVQIGRHFDMVDQTRRLSDIGSQLITTFDINHLRNVLIRQLPRLNIPSCYLALYEDAKAPMDKAKMIMAYDRQGAIAFDADTAVFPSKQLVLDGMLPTDTTYSMMVQPLNFQHEQLGYVLFETQNRDSLVYETLRVQISSSLKGALLVAQEEKRAHQLRTVGEVSSVTSTILDQNELLQQVVDLTKERFGLYHAHIYMLNENKTTLKLVAGAGQAGQQMVAENWMIPMTAERSLIAEAARSGQYVLVNDVHQRQGWLPNPALPDTASEMAVPISSKGEVIGVLDIQSDKVEGLEESDANLLLSLANNVAVSLINARLFAEIVQSKEEAEQAKEIAEQIGKEAEIARREAEAAKNLMEAQVWQTSGQAALNDKMRGEQDVPTLANNVIQQLCHYLDAQIGALYVVENDILTLIGTYAYSNKNTNLQFRLGEGLIGQAALEKKLKLISNVPSNYITVRTGLGEATPRHILVVPFLYEDEVIGVVEMGTLAEFEQGQMEFLTIAMSNIAIAFNTSQARVRINELLSQTQAQAEELQVQGEELRVANEELEAQTETLRASEAMLKEKQTELEITNVELEEKAAALEQSSLELREKQAVLDQQNRDLKVAQEELKQSADELALASKYKSEFLANMSHELRTPLNSLLILARLLVENKEGNLTPEQIESAEIIYSGGNDLLSLINDILDLSKVEAGKMVFNVEPTPLTDITTPVLNQFAHLAENKGLELNIIVDDDLPASIETDQQRLSQIIKNLMSNAFKFTDEGSVSLHLYRPDNSTNLSRSGLDPAQTIAISISDTGIGMTPEQQRIIFEAFQQADGSTSRQYGGTGLGLSISREFALKLGGHIDVTSESGKGSTFTIYHPIGTSAVPKVEAMPSRPSPELQQPAPISTPQPSDISVRKPVERSVRQAPIPDDRAEIMNGDKTLLIIEDDPKFAKLVYNHSREHGFKCLVAGDGETGLELIDSYQPSAIMLDLNLPDMSGWEILEVLKNDPAKRHTPVHIISADDEVIDAYHKGAMGYLTKPVNKEGLEASFEKIEKFISREIKSLLLVEDDKHARHSIKMLLGGSDVHITEADRGQVALNLLGERPFDCIILDLSLPDMTGFEVLNKINESGVAGKCPIIVYTGRDLSPEENHELMKYADSVIVKGIKSPERLLDETALFLHRVVSDMPQEKQQTIKQLYDQEGMLKEKKILIVDDDMRNSFALSKLLSEKGIVVRIAANGQKALDLLASESVDLILMDIMMPVMDGYETIRHIRSQSKYKTLPILALTAKAMKDDREKCLAAGADDYLPKPINIERLFSMLRVWLYK